MPPDRNVASLTRITRSLPWFIFLKRKRTWAPRFMYVNAVCDRQASHWMNSATLLNLKTNMTTVVRNRRTTKTSSTNTFWPAAMIFWTTVTRLDIRSTPMCPTPMYPGFCHSKAIVSTSGSMVGSYSYYTYAA